MRCVRRSAAAASLSSAALLALGDGTAMPVLGFGTYQIAAHEVQAPVLSALRAGYRHIDTAEGYGNECGVGEAVSDACRQGLLTREDLYITTKLWPGNPQWGQQVKSFDKAIQRCQKSLRKLDLGKVDLYLIHGPFSGGPQSRLTQWEALLECQHRGYTTSIGVSNYGISHLLEIEQAGLPLPAANQLEIHPFCQKLDILAYMTEKDIAPIAYSSLAPLSNWREGGESAKSQEQRTQPSPFRLMAEKRGWSEAQILLRWALDKGYAIIPKSTHEDRIVQNADLFSAGALSDEEIAAIANMDKNEAVAFGSPGEPFDPVTAL